MWHLSIFVSTIFYSGPNIEEDIEIIFILTAGHIAKTRPRSPTCKASKAILQTAAASGISVFIGAGDHGSTCRLTYVRTDDQTITVEFEMATPERPSEIRSVAEAIETRVTE